MTHVFVLDIGGLYGHWYGRECLILWRWKRKALCEFTGGEQFLCQYRALRKIK